MRKLSYLLIVVLSIGTTATAQDATVQGMQSAATKDVKSLDSNGWKRSGTFILNVNQGSLSNWAAGGEQSTLGINSLLNYIVNYRHGRNTWDNYFDFALGFQNATSFQKFRKIDDRIDVTSKYGYQLSKKWYAAALMNFNTQILEGFNYTDSSSTKISNLLTPGKLLLSVGLDYRPNNELSIFISPTSARLLIKKDKDFYDTENFGVPAQKKLYTEFGAYITAKYNKKITSWATYTGRLDLFSNYRKEPKNVDVFMTNLLAMKLNRWLATTLSVDLIYDDDILQRTQLKEILGLGLSVKL